MQTLLNFYILEIHTKNKASLWETRETTCFKLGNEGLKRQHCTCTKASSSSGPQLWAGASHMHPVEMPAGARASPGARAHSHTSGVPRRASPPASEPPGLQGSNSQLQAPRSVPRKQRRVLSFTRLEGPLLPAFTALVPAARRWEQMAGWHT